MTLYFIQFVYLYFQTHKLNNIVVKYYFYFLNTTYKLKVDSKFKILIPFKSQYKYNNTKTKS